VYLTVPAPAGGSAVSLTFSNAAMISMPSQATE
jgi:hypothetical protein